MSENGDYDLFYNAFVHLSRLEEWESEGRGKCVRSYSSLHPRKEKRIWRIPVVNYLFNELEARIRERAPHIEFDDGKKPTVEFSHDVDYIEKTVQLRLKQSAFDFLNACKYMLRLNFRKGLSRFGKGVAFAASKADYWCFDYWERLENEFNIKSVYYFFVKRTERKRFNLKEWLIDPSYNIADDNRLKKKCKELADKGNKIGLHGSYNSAAEEELFVKEKEILEDSIGLKVTKTRQHWLNYYERKTPYIHRRAGIEEDSTVGFNDISGFRAGIASLYAPYDHLKHAAFPFKIIPFAVMDSHLYDYADIVKHDTLEWLFESMKRIKRFHVSVDWHQRVVSGDYGWQEEYERILNFS